MAAFIDLVAELRHVDEVLLEVLLAAHVEGVDTLTVDRIFDLMLVFQPARDAEIRAEHPNRKDIVAVERKSHFGENPADGADRHSLEVNVLRSILPDAERFARGTDVRVADGERADLSSRIHIAFEQHRRDSEHIADIVETVCRIVGRQENRRIDFERQQIPDHVRILRPVQSRHQGTAGIRLRRGSAIQFCGQPGNQSIASRIVRTQRALRRHHPRPKLSDNFFPDSGVAAYRGKIHRVECEPGRFGGFVVASDTVLVEDGSVIGGLALRSRSDERGRGN